MINLYYKGERKSSSFFLPLLRKVVQYPFPKPLNCACLDKDNFWYESRIGSFTSKRFLEYIDDTTFQQIWVDNAASKRLNLYISQKKGTIGLGFNNIRCFISLHQVKNLFMDLIACESSCYEATCSPDISAILGRNFTSSQRQTKMILGWLEYLSKDAVESRGGFAVFESNPYLQTERLHGGLLVQIGEHPDVFATPEGEALLLNAINALPLVK